MNRLLKAMQARLDASADIELRSPLLSVLLIASVLTLLFFLLPTLWLTTQIPSTYSEDSRLENLETIAWALGLGFSVFLPLAFLIIGASLNSSIVIRRIAYLSIYLLPPLTPALGFIYYGIYSCDCAWLDFYAAMSRIFDFLFLAFIPLAIYGWARRYSRPRIR